MPIPRHLLVGHLEKISGKVLEDYPEIVKSMIRGKSGVYALYKKDRLYYVGLASNLAGRLKAHLRDRHKRKWDTFSVYVTRRTEHMKELESLLLRIAEPPGNRVRGGFNNSENMASTLRRAVKDYDEARRRQLLGKGTVASKVRQQRALARAGGVAQGAVPPGVVTRAVWLYASRGGYEYWAKLFKSGEIQYGSRKYPTPTAAARAATGKSVHGWSFWKYRNDKGMWVALKTLVKR